MSLPRPTSPENVIAAIAQAFDLLETGLEGGKLAIGTATITWPGGGATSNNLTVNHGLGRAPRIVLVVNTTNSGLNVPPVIPTFLYTATNFQTNASTIDAQQPLNSATTSIAWLAIA